jgi:eukaryotic-like serine/threonine-protein kinase
MADHVGQQLGNYRLLRLLGQGGFADVYLGQHLYLDSQAAIKIMHTHLAQEERESFRKEARIVAGLTHPHIVRLLDFDVQDGTPFLVMQFAPNGSLRLRHAPGYPLPPEVILPYVRQVADALCYVHERKLIHRDIKPENMLLGAEHEVLLSDFGVAIMAQSSRQQSNQNIGGTVAYMAPEQIQSQPCPASDQYALGVVVYEWLTGKRPFDGSFTEIATKHILVAPQPLRALTPALSLAIEAVVLRALAKDPRERFPSVLAFAQALEEAIGSDQSATLLAQCPALVASASAAASEPFADESLSTHNLISSPHTSQPTINAPTEQTAHSRRGISRRVVVLGLTGLAASGGALTWLALNRQSPGTAQAAHPTPTSQPTATPSLAPRPPAGTTLFTFKRHTDAVYTVAWSPDGTSIASGDRKGQALVWNAKTGAVTLTFLMHTAPVNAVAWSPDGTRIASGSSDLTVKIWDAQSGTILQTYKGHHSFVGTLAWSPNGQYIASGSGYPPNNPRYDPAIDHTVHVWNVQTGRLLFPPYAGHTGQVKQVAWSPDGTNIASASVDKTVQVWSASNGSLVYRFPYQSDEIWAVAWSPDGTRLASGSHDGTVQVWPPIAYPTTIIFRGHTEGVNAVAWSPDGKYLASGAGNTNDPSKSRDNTARIWTSDGIPLLVYKNHKSEIEAVVWSPDSTRVASASDDHTVQVWEAV